MVTVRRSLGETEPRPRSIRALPPPHAHRQSLHALSFSNMKVTVSPSSAAFLVMMSSLPAHFSILAWEQEGGEEGGERGCLKFLWQQALPSSQAVNRRRGHLPVDLPLTDDKEVPPRRDGKHGKGQGLPSERTGNSRFGAKFRTSFAPCC